MALRLASHCRLPTAATTIVADASVRFFSDKSSKRTSNVVKKKKKGKKSNTGEGGRDKQLDLVIRSLDAKKARPPPPDDEELARRNVMGRNYVIGRFEQHNALQHDLSCKIVMKQHAIKMLPRDSRIREQALNVNYGTTRMDAEAVPPLERHVPTEHPPRPKVDRRSGRK